MLLDVKDDLKQAQTLSAKGLPDRPVTLKINLVMPEKSKQRMHNRRISQYSGLNS